MKAKRIVVSTLMAAACALSLAVTAFAMDSGTITKNQVTLTGNVSGFRWPGILIDQIFYSASISGANADNVPPGTWSGGNSNKVYIQPGYNDDHWFSKIYLSKDKKSVIENNGRGCASFVSTVELYLWNQGDEKYLSSYLDS